MNNWRLLLLAVVTVLQPLGSFTERNLIYGHQECCDNRSNFVTQDTRLYGKITSEERRLSIQEIRKERQEARNEPVTRSKVRLSLERAKRPTYPESTIKFSAETRFVRDQERRHRISVDARESRQTREDQRRRTRERVSGHSIGQYERDVLDSRRIRMSRDHIRTGRFGNERLYRESFDLRDARRVRSSGVPRHVSVDRETRALFKRDKGNVAGEAVRRNFRNSAFRSAIMLELDNNRERRTLDSRTRDNADENRRSRSLDSGVSGVNKQEDRSQTDTREDRGINFRPISERLNEYRQRDQNRESRDRNSAIYRDLTEKIPTDRRLESRDSVERVGRTRRDIRNYRNNDRVDERMQQRDENQLSQERLSPFRESRLSLSAEQRQALARDPRILPTKVRSEKTVTKNDRTDERREASRVILRASRDTATERRQDSRVSRMIEATARDERFVRANEKIGERQQLSTRSLDRVSVFRSSRDRRSMEHEYNSRESAGFPERNVRDVRAARYRRDVRGAERLDERRAQHDGSRMSVGRTISILRESRNSAEQRQEYPSTAGLSRFEVTARSERESSVRGDENLREREERRGSREQSPMVRDTERKHIRELSRASRFTERAYSDERVSRVREDIRSEQLVANRETLDNNRASRDRTVVEQRLTFDVPAPQRRYDTPRTSQIAETNARLQRARILEDIRNERKELHERGENRASHDRYSMIRVSRERIEDQRRESLGNARETRVARNKVIRNRGDIRMSDRFEVRRQQDESRSQNHVSIQRESRDILAARSVERRAGEVALRNGEMTVRSERLSRTHDDKRINEREVRNNVRDVKDVEVRRESRRVIVKEREVMPNRHKLAIERMDRIVSRTSHDMKIGAYLKTDMNDDFDTRFRNIVSKVRGLNASDETSDYSNVMSWQMVFYTLQGAYLCSLVMQMLTEKSYKGKSRNFIWWASSSNDLVKVD